MKKDLNISRPKSDEFEYIDYPTNYKPLGLNEGRTGYCQVVRERREPLFEVGRFNGVINEFTTDFSPIPLESL